MRRLFGTSGVRGTLEELTPELAYRIALAFATLLGNEGTVGFGFDARYPTRVIRYAVLSGLLAGGLDVIDFGQVPTPAVLHAVKEYRLDAAVVVTGSHTPPEITGILLFYGDTVELQEEDEVRIEEMVFRGTYRRVPWSEIGKVVMGDALKPYVEHVVKTFGEGKFSSWRPRVLVDHGHAVTVGFLDHILELLGCEVLKLHDRIHGAFPLRSPYPHPSTLTELSRRVPQVQADLGLGVDGDGDRVLFADRDGTVLWGDVTGALLAREELRERGGGVIVCPINTSRIIEYVAQRYGGRVHYTKVGPPAMGRAVRELGSTVVFAFEETGKYIWPWNIVYGDPAVATAKILDIVKRYGSLREATAEFPRYYQFKEAVYCPHDLKQRVLEHVRRRVQEMRLGEVVDLDGVKVLLPDGWLLLRPSGTEPSFRIYVEAKTEERARELLNLGLKLVREVLPS